jgi:hypothetical protein
MIRHRWKSKFARFVSAYGVELLASSLDVRPSAIYHWIRGATSPRPAHAAIIQRLARERGGYRLTMDDIYGHSCAVRADNIKLETSLPLRPAAVTPAPLPPKARNGEVRGMSAKVEAPVRHGSQMVVTDALRINGVPSRGRRYAGNGDRVGCPVTEVF